MTAERNRRDEILHAALRLIGRHGCDGLSHRKIAQEAGVPLGSTTYYFSSRDELLLEAFRLYMRQFDTRLARGMDLVGQAGPDADPVQTVADFFVEVVRDELTDRTLLRAEIELIAHSADHRDLSVEFAIWERAMAKPLGEYLAVHAFAEPQELASALMRLTRGFEIQALTRSDMGYADYRAQLVRLLSAYRDPADV